MTARARFSFRVYGTEFCRMLEAVAQFQGPVKYQRYAAVRCVLAVDGLSLFASNMVAAAFGHVEVEDPDGEGMFSIPSSQVKSIRQTFKRALPKDSDPDEYVLEVTVTEAWIRIVDVSELFEKDMLQFAVPTDDDLGPGDRSAREITQELAAAAQYSVRDGARLDLLGGAHFNPVELGRVAKAAKILEERVNLRPVENRMLCPLGDSFTAVLGAGRHNEDEPQPYVDERNLMEWRERLYEIVERGVR